MTMHQMSFADLKAALDKCMQIYNVLSRSKTTYDQANARMWWNRADQLNTEIETRLDELFKDKT